MMPTQDVEKKKNDISDQDINIFPKSCQLFSYA